MSFLASLLAEFEAEVAKIPAAQEVFRAQAEDLCAALRTEGHWNGRLGVEALANLQPARDRLVAAIDAAVRGA